MTQTNALPLNPRLDPATDQDQSRQLLLKVREKIGNPNWDLLIVGDGSGSGWAHACGWASTLICNRTNARRFFYGAMDCGSINIAESMPYCQVLTWYDTLHGKDLLKITGHLNVHILTDSQVIARWGTMAMQPAMASELPRKQLFLYAGLRALREVGYVCHFHWAPRMTTELNWAADLMAGLTRAEIMKAGDPAYIAGADYAIRAANAVDNLVFYDPFTETVLNPYDVNPVQSVQSNGNITH